MDQTQSILPRLLHDGAIIGLFFKQCFKSKSFNMLGNVHPNMVMVALWDLIETPLYKNLNVNIHHQWASLFALHMNLEFQIPTYYNASFNNSNFDNQKIHCTLTNSAIDIF